MLQRNTTRKKKTRRFLCGVAQLRNREKKATTATVAFFMGLCCSATPQQTEEGDGSCRRLLRGVVL